VGAAGEEEEVGFQKGRGCREVKETEEEKASAPRVIVFAATDGCDASAVGAVFWCCVPRFWWRGCVTASPQVSKIGMGLKFGARVLLKIVKINKWVKNWFKFEF
jgi:hypothetical protein